MEGKDNPLFVFSQIDTLGETVPVYEKNHLKLWYMRVLSGF